MRPIQISSVCLFVFVLGSTLQAQNTTGGNQEDPFDTSASDTEFENVDRSGGIGATAQTGAGFSEVSAATGGTNTGARTSGGAGGGFGGFGGGFGGLGNFFSAFNGGGGQASKTAVRTRLRSAIDVAPRPPQVVQEMATDRFKQISGMTALRGIRVTMEGRTAVLTGQVSTERERRMSQLLVQLEPGVRQVDNRISVVK